LPLLQVLYVDSLETDALDVPIDGTRICIWTNKMVRLIADLDTNSDGTFGKLPVRFSYIYCIYVMQLSQVLWISTNMKKLIVVICVQLKHCYRNKISLFSADSSAVDTFIKCHAPREHDEKVRCSFMNKSSTFFLHLFFLSNCLFSYCFDPV
jgi:hypothetical protein